MHNKLWLILLIILWISGSCETPTKKRTVVSGKIIKPEVPEVVLHSRYYPFGGLTTVMDSLGEFKFEFELEKDTVLFFTNGWWLEMIYLSPGDSLHIFSDYRDYNTSAHFSGRCSEVNNLWKEMFLINKAKDEALCNIKGMINGRYYVDYVINRYKFHKIDKKNEYLTIAPDLLNNPLIKKITDFLIYVDDWKTYEIYNTWFPDKQIDYNREIPFSWKNRYPHTPTLLEYGYKYFYTKHLDQDIKNPETVKPFNAQVSDSVNDFELSEMIKLVNLTILLESKFFNLNNDDIKRLAGYRDVFLKDTLVKKKFDDYINAYSHSVEGGKIAEIFAVDLYCNLVALNEKLAENKKNILVILPSLEDFSKNIPKFKALDSKGNAIHYLFTRPVSKRFLINKISNNNMDLHNVYFLDTHEMRLYNFWRHKKPVIYVVNDSLTIEKVSLLKNIIPR